MWKREQVVADTRVCWRSRPSASDSGVVGAIVVDDVAGVEVGCDGLYCVHESVG